MGMYDYITCKIPITGGLPPWIDKHPLQTKDMGCGLGTYTIAEDGTFSVADFSGTIEFYSSNVVGSGPGIYTQDGEDAEYINCKAIFVHGKLLPPIEVHRRSAPAWPSSRQNSFSGGQSASKRTEDEQKQRYSERLIGKRVYILWGGLNKGYWGTVIAENDRELCIKSESESPYHKAGDFEVINRNFRDHIFWDSEEEALSRRKSQQSAWDAEVRAFVAYKAERNTLPKGMFRRDTPFIG